LSRTQSLAPFKPYAPLDILKGACRSRFYTFEIFLSSTKPWLINSALDSWSLIAISPLHQCLRPLLTTRLQQPQPVLCELVNTCTPFFFRKHTLWDRESIIFVVASRNRKARGYGWSCSGHSLGAPEPRQHYPERHQWSQGHPLIMGQMHEPRLLQVSNAHLQSSFRNSNSNVLQMACYCRNHHRLPHPPLNHNLSRSLLMLRA
jgi:hypothetical protein